MPREQTAAAPAGPPAPAFLGVEHSLTGRRWQARGGDDRLALAFAQRLGLPELVGRLLAARDVALEDAESHLAPSLRAMLPDPSTVLDMDRAVARLVRAVRDGERIAVFGDYDVDGATSAALLHRFLSAVGAPPRLYIPDRMREGYGPNAAALRALREEGARVVITVDCGTTAFAALQAAADCGLETVVVDHHVAEPALPTAVAVINPNRLDECGANRQLAAVGVTFLLVVALNRALRASGWYAASGRAEPDLRRWLDLVALGTVADVVPLTGLNRALVARGIKVMAQRGNAGLAALADVARMAEAPGAYHLGFLLGPRVNAGGRVGTPDLGVRLLTTDEPAEAAALAAQLDALNGERQRIEAEVQAAAIAQIEGRRSNGGESMVLVAGRGWHPGVIGIVAGRLRERYNLPACVVTLDAAGMGKGSGRSVPGIDLGGAVLAARQAGLLVDGGGHSMAAGFTVREASLEALGAFLSERIGAAMGEVGAVPRLRLDGALTTAAATPELVTTVSCLGPFGQGNAEPRFAIADARITWARQAGDSHVAFRVTDASGATLKAIAFRCLDNPLGAALLGAPGTGMRFHLAGHLRLDTWNGETRTQLHLNDAAPAGER